MLNSESLSATYETLNYQRKVATNLLTEWYIKARTNQIVIDHSDYNIYLFLAGRGWGKTLTGAYDILQYCLLNEGVICGVVAPTYGDIKRVCFGGESGLIGIIDPSLLDNTGYNKSSNEIHFFNGSRIIGIPAESYDRLRGVQFHRVWLDEFCSFRYPEAFDNVMMALRLGKEPKCVITTTPKPTKTLKTLVKRSDVKIIKGSTFDNAKNLPKSTIEMLKERYSGTSVGRQELYAEILTETEGSLWTYEMIDKARISNDDTPEMERIVIAIDPAVTSNDNSDETGMIVAGLGADKRYYILEDASGKMSPDGWCRLAVDLYYKYQADRIVAETNNGGDLVEKLLRTIDSNVPYTPVTATRGKVLRAEPISALYEQGKVFHVGTDFAFLEEQQCTFTSSSNKSPDRLDALVWALTELSQNTGTAFWRVS